MSPSRPFILRPVATSLLMVAILLAGFVAYVQLPVSALPQVDYPTIQVQTFYPGASPEVMASSVTAPLERQFGQIPGLSQMTSTSSGGGSVITLQFSLAESIDVAQQDVQAAINAAFSYLPKDLPNPPVYSKVTGFQTCAFRSCICEILDFRQRQRVARQRQRHDRRVSRIYLAVNRWVGQVFREIAERRIDRRLHILLCHVDRVFQHELQRNHTATAGAGRCHLAQTRYLSKLPFQRGRHRRSHHLRAGTRIERLHLDRRIVHLRQRRNRQLQVRDRARKQNGHHQKRGGHRPKNKWP